MRRITRLSLPPRVATYLGKRQAGVTADVAGATADRLWKTATRTKAMAAVRGVLRQMARRRERCMYCEDSRGTAIEHFWPKGIHADRMFEWANLLLVCEGCNTVKGTHFPLDARGSPLLIDPTTDDPWNHLFFEPLTGQVTRRYVAGAPDPKGTQTTEVLKPLNYEAITEGRCRTQRNLVRAVEAFLTASTGQPCPQAGAIHELREAVRDNDNHGLGQWYFLKDGQNDPPFAALRQTHPRVWSRLQSLVM